MNLANNRVSSWFSGLIIALSVFSPSGTALMIKSYIQSGILKMRQAIPVIIGAIAAEGIIVWILVLEKQPGLSYFLLGIGFLFYYLSPSQRVISWASFLFGLGLLYEGLGLAQEALFTMRLYGQSETFTWEFLNAVSPLHCVGLTVLSVILTIAFRSGLTVVALAGLLLTSGLINELAAFSLVLGTLPALQIVTLFQGGRLHFEARRAIVFMLLLNIFVVLLCQVFSSEILSYLNKVTIVMSSGYVTVATYSSLFALVTTGFGLIGMRVFNSLAHKFVETPEVKESYRMQILGRVEYLPASLAVQQADLEVNKLFAMVQTMIEQTAAYVFQTEEGVEIERRVAKYETITDSVDKEIHEYLLRVSELRLSTEEANLLNRNLKLSFELETIGDACTKIIGHFKRYRMSHSNLSSDLLSTYKIHFDATARYFESMFSSVLSGELGDLEKLRGQRQVLRDKSDSFRVQIEQSSDKLNIKEALLFDEVRLSTDRISRHSKNIIEAYLVAST